MSGLPRAIGGELELPPEALHGGAEPPAPFVAVESGRSALRLVARLLPADRPVLLPEYLCDSVVRPFAAEGREVAFYEVGSSLAVEAAVLRARALETRASAVLAIDYFGFPLGIPALAALPEEIVAIEDRSHGSFLEQGPAGSPPRMPTYRVTSLRKYLPLPDGALADGPGLAQPPRLTGSLFALRVRAKAVRHEALARGGDEELEREALALVARSERDLDAAEPEAAAPESLALLARLDLGEAMRRRRANYAFLLEAFARDDRLAAIASPLLPSLPAGVSPLTFPVRVHDGRDRLRAALVERRVFCPVHWPLPDAGVHASEPARRLSAELLSLPVDQRYGEAEMAELVERLASVRRVAV